jgi:hypothetical protein
MRSMTRAWGGVALSLLAAALATAGVCAQSEHQHDMPMDAGESWTWSWSANVFAGWNDQLRKFRDFATIESQNWFMGGGEHPFRGGRLRLHTMLSAEPFTIQPLGSPEVFQTGETYHQAPLIDYQHPHDLVMDLGGTWVRPLPSGRAFFEAAVVGAPAIGPTPFMHRASAEENPTVPLSHHQLDATHITHGVLTAGLEQRGLTLEGSWFRGAEPDENRKDIEMGKLDSYSGRLSWKRSGWDAQVSAAHLKTPEYVEQFSDVIRWTASIGYTEASGRLAATLAWGENREVHGNLDGYLLEAVWRPHARHSWYARTELTTKDILSPGGRHPKGFVHFHPLSRVGALTVGHVFDLGQTRAGRFGLGGDVTGYYVAPALRENYGSPFSFHVFLHYRAGTMTAHAGHQ